jgi:hypothetical protein
MKNDWQAPIRSTLLPSDFFLLAFCLLPWIWGRS